MEGCVFCDKNLNKIDNLHETENFFVKVGLGLAAPGHVMVISKQHYPCFADMAAGLRQEYEDLKKLVYGKAKENFSEPFLVEYGILEQSVPHAHLHFIPKERKETEFYPGYKIGDLFEEIGIPSELMREEATWERAEYLRKEYGGYVFLKDKQAYLFAGMPVTFPSKNLSYRRFFNYIYKITDIPLTWKSMTDQDKKIDAIKKDITKKMLVF